MTDFADNNISMEDLLADYNAHNNVSSIHDILADFTNTLYTYNDPVVIVLLVFYLPIFLLALTGNILVLIITFTSGGIKNVTNSFLLNLTCSDLLGKIC